MTVRSLLHYHIAILLGSLMFCSLALAKPPRLGLQNSDDHSWIHRRDPGTVTDLVGDPDKALAYAVVFHADSDLGSGKLWYYTGRSADRTKYTNRQGPIQVTGIALEKGTAGRRRRLVFLKDSSDNLIGYVTMYQGSEHKSGSNSEKKAKRKDQRVVFRWNTTYATQLAGKASEEDPAEKPAGHSTQATVVMGTTTMTTNCDEPPEDDPMEEEPFIPDPMDPMEELPVDP